VKVELPLSGRDRLLFDFLYKFKVATVDDIRELAFQGIGQNHVYARLKQLVLYGYIQKIPYFGGKRVSSAYSITKKTFLRFICDETAITTRKKILSDSIHHDLGLVTIYKRLRHSKKVTKFIPENVLISGSDIIRSLDLWEFIKQRPDGLIETVKQKKVFYLPLEYEASVKACSRYESKLLNYYMSSTIPAVLYVCGNESVRRAICRIEQKRCEAFRAKVFYASFKQFQSGESQLTFTNRNDEELIF